MFSRISLALLVVVKKVSTVNAFLSRGMSLGHLNALKTITRPFLSTYDGFNSNDKVRKTADTLEDQINQLQSEISATKGRRDELLSSNRDPAAIALTGEVIFLIFPFFFSHRLTKHFLCPITFDPATSPIQVWQRRKVSDDESPRNVVFMR